VAKDGGVQGRLATTTRLVFQIVRQWHEIVVGISPYHKLTEMISGEHHLPFIHALQILAAPKPAFSSEPLKG
jgi:hypothetical protein